MSYYQEESIYNLVPKEYYVPEKKKVERIKREHQPISGSTFGKTIISL